MSIREAVAAGVVATLVVTSSAFATVVRPEDVPPEQVIEKMSVKLVRGVTNVVTAPVELPKQLYTTTRDKGIPGPLIGLFKGVGMTAYRAVFGVLEAAFFLIPAPGYYDPMTNPAYVWQGWRPKCDTSTDSAPAE